jgi:ProP effector
MTITKEQNNAALVRLAEQFPQTFVAEKHQPHRPLKWGIAADIAARCPELKRRARGTALSVYTGRIAYLQSLVAGAARIDLDGNPAGEVTAEEAEYAAARLAEILAPQKAWQDATQARREAKT